MNGSVFMCVGAIREVASEARSQGCSFAMSYVSYAFSSDVAVDPAPRYAEGQALKRKAGRPITENLQMRIETPSPVASLSPTASRTTHLGVPHGLPAGTPRRLSGTQGSAVIAIRNGRAGLERQMKSMV